MAQWSKLPSSTTLPLHQCSFHIHHMLIFYYISQMQAHICGFTTMENHDNTTTMKVTMPVAVMVAGGGSSSGSNARV
jgi:hypothetical protein